VLSYYSVLYVMTVLAGLLVDSGLLMLYILIVVFCLQMVM